MSWKGKDDMNDWIQDHEMELLYEYLENEAHWKEFTDWLYANDQHDILEALFEHFITQGKGVEVERFNQWATDKAVERLSGAEEIERGDR